MIHHSIIPVEYIFSNSNDPGNIEYSEFIYKGVRAIGRKVSEHEYVIDRIISTDPQVFLNPDFQPGTVVNITRDGIKMC